MSYEKIARNSHLKAHNCLKNECVYNNLVKCELLSQSFYMAYMAHLTQINFIIFYQIIYNDSCISDAKILVNPGQIIDRILNFFDGPIFGVSIQVCFT